MAENQVVEASTPPSGKVMDLLELCRRILCEWQYYCPKIKYEKLAEIELNFPYADPRAAPPSPHHPQVPFQPVASTSTAAAITCCSCGGSIHHPGNTNLKCTRYTVVFQHDVDERKITTFKNFFTSYPAASSFTTKKKERIYWGIRLRYVGACSTTFCHGILKLGKLLKENGYIGWKLPNGQIIGFEALWVGFMLADTTCKLLIVRNIHKSSTGQITADLNDPFDQLRTLNWVDGIPPLPSNVFVRRILVAKLPVNDEIYVIDPVSMQFHVRGPSGGLIMHGSWPQYKEVWPGQIPYSYLEADAEVNLATSNVSGMIASPAIPDFLGEVIAGVLKGIDNDCCEYCGQINRIKAEKLDSDEDFDYDEVKLLTCEKCMRAKYCDVVCQIGLGTKGIVKQWKPNKLQILIRCLI